MSSDARTEEVHDLIRQLPRFDWTTPAQAMPANGIYFFFEQGETAPGRGGVGDRIVRVGTHRVDSRFRGRIRQHYGRVRTIGGNKNGSVFRLHVGGALMRRSMPADSRLPEWLRQMGASDPQVEAEVSQVLRDGFTFACVRVDEATDRLGLERGLIALLAQQPASAPSTIWLGQHAAAESIRRTGLWNTQHVDARPLSTTELAQFRVLANLAYAEVDG